MKQLKDEQYPKPLPYSNQDRKSGETLHFDPITGEEFYFPKDILSPFLPIRCKGESKMKTPKVTEYSPASIFGERIKLGYRSYRKGKNRCRKCGGKLDDTAIPNHEHKLGFWEKKLIDEVMKPNILLETLKSIRYGKTKGVIIKWQR